MICINNLKNSFNRNVKMCGQDIQIFNNINKSTSNIYKVLIKEIKDKTLKDTKELFASVDIPLKQGDTIVYNNVKYLIVQVNENTNGVYNIYNIRRISNQLNFKFADDIYSIDIIVDDSIAKIGNGDVPISEGRIEIISQANKITKYIREQTRLLLWGRCYEIEGYTETDKDMIKFYCKTTQIDTSIDNIENGIAYNKKLLNIFIKNKYEVVTSCDNIDLKQQQELKLNIVFKKNGEIEHNPNVTYTYDKSVVNFDEDTMILTGKKTGNMDLYIKYNNVVKIIHINVQENIYTLEIDKYDIKLNVGDTYNINVVAKKNDVIVNNPTLEYIISNGGIANACDKIITGIAKGETIIIIKYENAETVINVTVKEDENACNIIGNDYIKLERIGKWTLECSNPQNDEIIWQIKLKNGGELGIEQAKIIEKTNKSIVFVISDYKLEGKKLIIKAYNQDKSISVEKEIMVKSTY